MQAGNNKHEHIIESMTLFAKEVMPEFKERRPEIEARKAERLAPTLERLNKLAAVEEHPDLGDHAIVAEPYQAPDDAPVGLGSGPGTPARDERPSRACRSRTRD